MPITKSAIKKLKGDKKKATFNKATRTKAKSAVDSLRAEPTQANLSKAFSMIDKAAKKGVLKKGKADRMKARLSKKVTD
jgi:small subunit ribosomal protein S20